MREADNNFRPDIEAMRALAVLGVLLFHAGTPGFSGGFAGVDVFFVISGFLITRLLMRELTESGSIDLLAFWVRRAWRLLPNALLTLTAILILTWLLKPAEQQQLVSTEVGAALLYAANYWFAARAHDYFDSGEATSPVLHFWSLGVEEQFYFVWPCLLLLVCWRNAGAIRSRVAIAAAAVCIASFAISIIWMGRSQPAAFFHTEARIWQLATGAVLASIDTRIKFASWFRESAGWCGLAGILGSFVILSDAAYPGVNAIAPVGAAALLIASGHGGATAVSRLLRARPLQWIGRRSYSIYLWHWPILIFTAHIRPEGPLSMATTIAFIVVVAALAFALVEEPMRHAGAARWPALHGFAMPVAACITVGLAAIGLSQAFRLSPEREALIAQRIAVASADGPRIPSIDGCSALFGSDARTGCRFGSGDSSRTVVLFGDSYAEHYFDGLDAAARDVGWSMRLWTRSSCPPVDATTIDTAKRIVDSGCLAWREAAIRQLISDKPQLVLIASWAGIAESVADQHGRPLPQKLSIDAWRQGFSSVLRRLRDAGLEVGVIRSVPRGAFDQLHACLGSAAKNGCGRPRLQAIANSAIEHEVAATVSGVELIDFADNFCGPNVCYTVRDDLIVYRDRQNHLTGAFSLALKPAFERLLRKLH